MPVPWNTPPILNDIDHFHQSVVQVRSEPFQKLRVRHPSRARPVALENGLNGLNQGTPLLSPSAKLEGSGPMEQAI